MTKKDYLLIANALRRTKPQQGPIIYRRKDRYHVGKVMAHEQVVDAITLALSLENPLFNKDKFREAIDR